MWHYLDRSLGGGKRLLHFNTNSFLEQTHAKGGHFMEEDLGLFDAGFFSYSAETAAVSIFGFAA